MEDVIKVKDCDNPKPADELYEEYKDKCLQKRGKNERSICL